ncbi:TRAG family protein [Bacillus paramycoides]|uniref:TRAG family protein n=1 Tax=Bacillus paramycoides TaxID=2026194 RepID=UPI003D06A350
MKNLGKLREDVMQRKSAWLAEELMQAVSIAQTVIKPLKQHDYWMESATKLLAGSILYLDQRHKNLYYLDVKQVIEFTEKIYENEANLVEVVGSLEIEHPAYHIFQELGLYSKETRDAIIINLLSILEKHQREKQGEQKAYFWFQ